MTPFQLKKKQELMKMSHEGLCEFLAQAPSLLLPMQLIRSVDWTVRMRRALQLQEQLSTAIEACKASPTYARILGGQHSCRGDEAWVRKHAQLVQRFKSAIRAVARLSKSRPRSMAEYCNKELCRPQT